MQWYLSDTQTQMEITMDIMRRKVTKARNWSLYYVTSPSNDINISNCWLLSLLTKNLYWT